MRKLMLMAYMYGRVMNDAGEGGGGSIDPFLIPDGLEDYEPTGGEGGEGGNGDEGGHDNPIIYYVLQIRHKTLSLH